MIRKKTHFCLTGFRLCLPLPICVQCWFSQVKSSFYPDIFLKMSMSPSKSSTLCPQIPCRECNSQSQMETCSNQVLTSSPREKSGQRGIRWNFPVELLVTHNRFCFHYWVCRFALLYPPEWVPLLVPLLSPLLPSPLALHWQPTWATIKKSQYNWNVSTENHFRLTVRNEAKLFHVVRTEHKNLSKSALTRVMVSFSSVSKQISSL